VVINNSQLALISAATKACTFRVVAFREGMITGSVSYRIDTGCIASNCIGYFYIGENPILHASLQDQQLLTGRITQDNQRAFASRHPPQVNSI